MNYKSIPIPKLAIREQIYIYKRKESNQKKQV